VQWLKLETSNSVH